jgi:hypothetical protein
LQDRGKQDERDSRLEQARKGLLVALDSLRSERILTGKEADAVEAAIEDEPLAEKTVARTLPVTVEQGGGLVALEFSRSEEKARARECPCAVDEGDGRAELRKDPACRASFTLSVK